MAWRKTTAAGSGLHNHGNTCFLNSVVQCITYTPPLANYLLSREHSTNCMHFFHLIWIVGNFGIFRQDCWILHVVYIGKASYQSSWCRGSYLPRWSSSKPQKYVQLFKLNNDIITPFRNCTWIPPWKTRRCSWIPPVCGWGGSKELSFPHAKG